MVNRSRDHQSSVTGIESQQEAQWRADVLYLSLYSFMARFFS